METRKLNWTERFLSMGAKGNISSLVSSGCYLCASRSQQRVKEGSFDRVKFLHSQDLVIDAFK